MTPLIRKEIRLLLPFIGIALFLAAVPVWFFSREYVFSGVNRIVYWAFALGAVLLGLAPFGQELSLGTFSVLFSEPCERRRIWNIKVLLVLAAMLLVFAVFLVSIRIWLDSSLNAALQRLESFETQRVTWLHAHHRSPIIGEIPGPELPAEVYAGRELQYISTEIANRNWYRAQFWESCRFSCLLLLAAVTGGLWTTLLFRQIGAALWFAILIPGGLLLAVPLVFRNSSDHAQAMATPAIFACYSVFGFVWARRMFLRAQDAQWFGGTISLTAVSPAKARTEFAVARRRKPAIALLRKEFQLQQMSLLIAFGLFVLHGCTLIYRKFGALPTNSEMRFTLELVPVLWLLMPWLVGSGAMAEERKLGTMGNQMCLPFPRGLQFLVKLGVVFLFGIALGGICPWIIERLGLLFNISSEFIRVSPARGQFTLAMLLTTAASVAAISFYASSLTRNMLHALGTAVIFGVAFLLSCACLWRLLGALLSERRLLESNLLAVFALVLWLAYANFKRLEADRKLWLQNLSVLLFVFAFVWTLNAVSLPRYFGGLFFGP